MSPEKRPISRIHIYPPPAPHKGLLHKDGGEEHVADDEGDGAAVGEDGGALAAGLPQRAVQQVRDDLVEVRGRRVAHGARRRLPHKLEFGEHGVVAKGEAYVGDVAVAHVVGAGAELAVVRAPLLDEVRDIVILRRATHTVDGTYRRDWTREDIPLEDERLRAIHARLRLLQGAYARQAEGLARFDRWLTKRLTGGELPKGWRDALNQHKKAVSVEAPGWATRKASGEALAVLTGAIPEMIGGSADLTGSVNTKTPSTEPVAAGNFKGRYIHYGVREHGMAAAMNGMALHGGVIPYSGTFLVFADYMRGAIRLSALMGQRVIYVLTHDSIGLGEDGPTHQAVETMASLRAMPNFHVLRPCDGVETAECWALALSRKNGPSGMVLTRQGLPTVRVEHTDDNLSARGAYVLAEADGGDRQVTLLATGSEVQIAMQARETLQGEGIPAAVVSMPCWELFDKQDEAYRQQVLGPGTVRVAVEAAIRQGWDRYIRSDGGFVGMTGFGASAPAGKLFKHFGITAEAVVSEVKKRLS